MFFSTPGQLTAIYLMVLFHQSTASSLATAFCSSLNTAADSTKVSNTFNSQGACESQCEGDWAFGVLQDKLCWCTNFAPGVSTDTSDCSDSCPGYPSDTCGNSGEGLYEYIALNLAASGTQGGSTSSAAAATTSIPPVTVTATPDPLPPVTITETPSTPPAPSSSSTLSSSSSQPVVIQNPTTTTDTTTPSTTAAPSSTPTSTSSSTETSSSSTWTPTPVASIETVTNGQIRTVTVTPTSSPSAAASESLTADHKSSGGSSLSGGQAAGLTIGLIGFIAIVSGIAFFCWRKRRQQKEISEYGGISRQGSMLVSNGPHPPSRTMSENSRYVLATDGRAVYPAWENDDNQPGSRSSRLVPVDPRLDPYAGIYQQPGGGRSHESVNTIHDGRDYSRRVATAPILRATNPDPDTNTDSETPKR